MLFIARFSSLSNLTFLVVFLCAGECEVDCAMRTVMHVCHGKRRCRLEATRENFGDPCRAGIPPYLSVVYTCGEFCCVDWEKCNRGRSSCLFARFIFGPHAAKSRLLSSVLLLLSWLSSSDPHSKSTANFPNAYLDHVTQNWSHVLTEWPRGLDADTALLFSLSQFRGASSGRWREKTCIHTASAGRKPQL